MFILMILAADMLGLSADGNEAREITGPSVSTPSAPLVAVSAADRGLLLLGLPASSQSSCMPGALAVLECDMHIPDVLKAALPQQPNPWMRPLLLGESLHVSCVLRGKANMQHVSTWRCQHVNRHSHCVNGHAQELPVVAS